jgi:mono/diheme cytochrome c family protein
MRLFKQLVAVFAVLGILVGVLMIFAYDVIKIDWISFMEIQSSYGTQEHPLPVPPLSIPVEGPAYIPGAGAPENPVPSDKTSLARGAQLFSITCQICHGDAGQGDGPVAGFLIKKKPADLSSPLIQSMPDGTIFLVISNGFGYMPALNENLTVRERWDVVNYIRTLKAAQP